MNQSNQHYLGPEYNFPYIYLLLTYHPHTVSMRSYCVTLCLVNLSRRFSKLKLTIQSPTPLDPTGQYMTALLHQPATQSPTNLDPAGQPEPYTACPGWPATALHRLPWKASHSPTPLTQPANQSPTNLARAGHPQP